MAHGPCGEQFRAAFSCFVFSQEEPKGVDCIEHFKTMQNCFREHPDIYGAELDDDEEGVAESMEGETAPVPSEPAPQTQVASTEPPTTPKEPAQQSSSNTSSIPTAAVSAKNDPTPALQNDSVAKADADSEDLVPRAWHDSRDSTQSK